MTILLSDPLVRTVPVVASYAAPVRAAYPVDVAVAA